MPGLVLSWVIVPASRGGAGRSKQDRALFCFSGLGAAPTGQKGAWAIHLSTGHA